MSTSSSDDEAPVEISFNQAQKEEKARRREVPGLSKKIAKTVPTKPKAAKLTKKKLDPMLQAMLADEDEAEAEKILAQRNQKFERVERASQNIALNPALQKMEEKINSNLKVICLRKVPVIPQNDKYKSIRQNLLYREDLPRRPLQARK